MAPQGEALDHLALGEHRHDEHRDHCDQRTRHQQVVSGAGELPLRTPPVPGDHHQCSLFVTTSGNRKLFQFCSMASPRDVAEDRTRSLADGLLVGTPEQVTERLKEVSGLGMSSRSLNFAEVAYDLTSLNLFTEKAFPLSRNSRSAPRARRRGSRTGWLWQSAAYHRPLPQPSARPGGARAGNPGTPAPLKPRNKSGVTPADLLPRACSPDPVGVNPVAKPAVKLVQVLVHY